MFINQYNTLIIYLIILWFPIISHFIYHETKYREDQGKNLFLGSIRNVGLYQTSSLQPTRASLGDNTEKNQGNKN